MSDQQQQTRIYLSVALSLRQTREALLERLKELTLEREQKQDDSDYLVLSSQELVNLKMRSEAIRSVLIYEGFKEYI